MNLGVRGTSLQRTNPDSRKQFTMIDRIRFASSITQSGAKSEPALKMLDNDGDDDDDEQEKEEEEG